MTTTEVLDDLRSRILSRYSLISLRTYEEDRWENLLADLALELERGFVVWSITSGPQPPLDSRQTTVPEPLELLDQIARVEPDHLFLLKDFHPYLSDPKITRKLRDLLPILAEQRKTLVWMGPVENTPIELLKDVTSIELPLPGIEEMTDVLRSTIDRMMPGRTVETNHEEHMVKAVLGLTTREAGKAFARALTGVEEITEEVYPALVREKRHMVQGSDLLEFFDLDESIDSIGGLEALKDWVKQRSEAYSSDARARGISYPKGVLLAGVQGCGKSLSAKAIARVLGFPLVRMDMANLLESTRGGSEQNLREVLRLMEMIAPSVLWLEEIDKAFAGFDSEAGSGGDATMSRIIARFLTWLQEHTSPVFVVATANNVSKLPPELLRRGRFDEMFFVDLPNFHERKMIFGIHLKKRGWKPDKFDIETLSNNTEGYSGAEIEQIVNAAIIESYSKGRMLSDKDLDDARELLVPLSVTMEDQIFGLREWARTRCRPATPDSRIMQIMEEEERRGEQDVQDGSGAAPKLKWLELAEHGQIAAAVVEHVRFYDNVTFDRLLNDFGNFAQKGGDFGLVLRADPKVVLWTRMSQDFADMIAEFIAKKRLYITPVTPEPYAGTRHPNLPVVEELVEEKQEKPVWLPTVLRLVPPRGGSAKFSTLARIRMGK
ncbi:AAA family ATPase [Planctomyces sp. SH-PL14]|uniref:AAA family ATPase n=1 Tax=Planctomyces sp. SH-PL14 TaxID=1632864 RepID=UPI00078CE88A|nr:AAA family ATPase [Planctomyces sp. SH-PL14]AMV21383.1 ATP-dependent zinc metalloprotease FtsH 2 [Planctomyces sp. SH-PL14]